MRYHSDTSFLTVHGKDALVVAQDTVRDGQLGKGIEGVACLHPFQAREAGIAMLGPRDRLLQGREPQSSSEKHVCTWISGLLTSCG